MEQISVTTTAEKGSVPEAEKMLHERASRGDWIKYQQALDRVPDTIPLYEEDKLN